MKKLLLILFGVVVISMIAQKFGLLNYFPSNPNPITENKITNTLPVKISPTISRPVIGIHYRMIDQQTALQYNLVEGAYITQVIKESPAEKYGLQEEDIIIELDGNKISSNDKQTLTKLISEKKPGEKAALKIWRNKEIKTIFINL